MSQKEYTSYRSGEQKVEFIPNANVTMEPGENGTKVILKYVGDGVNLDDEVALGTIIRKNTESKQESSIRENKKETKESRGHGRIVLIAAVAAAAILGAFLILKGCNRVEQEPTISETIVQEVEVDVTWEGEVLCEYYPNGLNGTIYYPENPSQLEGLYDKSDLLKYINLTDTALSDISKLSEYRFRDDSESWKCTIDVAESLRNTFEEQDRIEKAAREEAQDILDLGEAHTDSIDRQQLKTEENSKLAVGMDEWGNVLEQAMQDKEDGTNYIDEVSSKITKVRTDGITGNVDIEIEGVVRSCFTCTGETQEEVWQQIQAFYEEYQPYTDEKIRMTTSIQKIIGNDRADYETIFYHTEWYEKINDIINRTIESYSLEFLKEIKVPESTQTVTTPIISEEEVRDIVQRTPKSLLEKVKGWFGNFTRPKSSQEHEIEK